ncbi:MAG: rubredoxin [Lachnospiraceae bacterium]|nr:rubredoxin [Lachnospiraceae bacterium]
MFGVTFVRELYEKEEVGYVRYICQICGYVYDDDKEAIPFDQLPDDWKCPLCGATKADFKAESVGEDKVQVSVNTESADLKKLSAGQLAAVCSNLARGCEKQYKMEESELFLELAKYFSSITPEVNDATVEGVAKLLQEDIDEYPNVRAVADQSKDRGAARVCVWGEKVTRMLSSLVTRYLNEGEEMLRDTDIWICTVCGFVYIGEKPPELCPVCKVPPYKFEKIEGRA